jgi:hypothetical protein
MPLQSEMRAAKIQLNLSSTISESLKDAPDLSALQHRIWQNLSRGVQMDGMHYSHDGLDVNIKVGTDALHSCGYRLLCADEYLGEIVFMRKHRFTERELAMIEALIPSLVTPLRNSLRSRKADETKDLLTGV